MRSCLALVLLAACAGGEAPTCEEASIDAIEVVTGDPPAAVEENGIVPYVRGGQGLMMALVQIGYRASELPPCIERTLYVESQTGTPFFHAYPVTSTELEGDFQVEPTLQIIEPPFGDLVVNVEAYGTTLRRTVDPTYPPSFSTLTGPPSANVGVPFEVTLELTHATPQAISLRVTTAANVEAPEVIAYGETGATLTITAEASGPLEVTVEDATSSQIPPPSIMTAIDVQ